MDLSENWNQRIQTAINPLPGLRPYANNRRFGVGGKYDQYVLREFLLSRHPHISCDVWERAAEEGRLSLDGRICADLERKVRAGNVVSHLIEDFVEPAVSSDMRLLFEDDRYIAIDKPAPLPVHPSGQYNRHTVVSFLKAMFPDMEFKPVHRLDADTTGVLLLARSREAARIAGQCFREKRFTKVYLARVHGAWSGDSSLIDMPIGKSPVDKGGRALELLDGQGLASATTVEMLGYSESEDSSLLKVVPATGRTNQIRLHLASMGHPIVGDQAYGASNEEHRAFTTGFLCLHAHRLSLPSMGEGAPALELESPAPGWAHGVDSNRAAENAFE